MVPEFHDVYKAHYYTKYYPLMGKLRDHVGTIELFETALNSPALNDLHGIDQMGRF
jgi:hypothetical protein